MFNADDETQDDEMTPQRQRPQLSKIATSGSATGLASTAEGQTRVRSPFGGLRMDGSETEVDQIRTPAMSRTTSKEGAAAGTPPGAERGTKADVMSIAMPEHEASFDEGLEEGEGEGGIAEKAGIILVRKMAECSNGDVTDSAYSPGHS